MIQTGMSRKEANELRIGWDLVLDIDAPDWEISRLTAWLFVKAIEAHGIESVTVKFSGNKGWHIGVPWESFPKTIVADDGEEQKTSDLFPEIPRAIATYLIDFIGNADNGLDYRSTLDVTSLQAPVKGIGEQRLPVRGNQHHFELLLIDTVQIHRRRRRLKLSGRKLPHSDYAVIGNGAKAVAVT